MVPASCSDKTGRPRFLPGPRPLVDSASCSEMPWDGPRPVEHGLPGSGSPDVWPWPSGGRRRAWPCPERDIRQEHQKGKHRKRPPDLPGGWEAQRGRLPPLPGALGHRSLR